MLSTSPPQELVDVQFAPKTSVQFPDAYFYVGSQRCQLVDVLQYFPTQNLLGRFGQFCRLGERKF
jgi:hypothetical protein